MSKNRVRKFDDRKSSPHRESKKQPVWAYNSLPYASDLGLTSSCHGERFFDSKIEEYTAVRDATRGCFEDVELMRAPNAEKPPRNPPPLTRRTEHHMPARVLIS
ncbi:hypothetical protein FOL47_005637 [Perkinsus chesapeaki]|uniref:Uncharacterized protein n=1 Tax=Perkinsus chesapeaki TaxID=330153 RepID=A0A7J6MYY9_PERCH|nr:hypothetical protein FOL47_005637 [Perkinsus chesapeaki]